MIKQEALAYAKQWRKAWAAALRSGNYQQGQEHLVQEDSDHQRFYCCLGVACDIIPIVEWTPAPPMESLVNIAAKVKRRVFPEDGHRLSQSDGSYLPDEIRCLLLVPNGEQDFLVSMNDGDNDDFLAIAEEMERRMDERMNEAWDMFEDYWLRVDPDSLPTPPNVPQQEVTTTP